MLFDATSDEGVVPVTRTPPAKRIQARRRRYGVGLAIALLVMMIGALVVPAIAAADETTGPDAATEAVVGDRPAAPEDAAPPALDESPTTEADTPTTPVDADTPADENTDAPAPDLAGSAAPLDAPASLVAQATSAASDSRATFVDDPSVGNQCVNADLSGTTYTTGNSPSNGSTIVGGLFTITIADYDAPGDVQAPSQILNGGTPAGDAQMVQLSGIGAGVTINGVVVKGGAGYNKYVFGTNAGYLGVNMISPLNGGGKVPALSHAFVCYTADPTTGSLTVTKTVVGPVPDNATFTVTVSCPAIGTPLDGFPKTLVFDDTGALTSGTLPITDIPTGTVCEVEETSTGGADSVSYTLNAGSDTSTPPTPIIAADQTQTVAVTNTYNEPETGSLDVTKTVEGPAPADATFTVTVSCPAVGTPLDGFPKTFTFDDGGVLISGVLPITGIPTGTVCEVEETGNGGATSVTYAVNGGSDSATVPTPTIVSGETQTVAVTNTFVEVGGEFSGRVNIEKKITGVPPAEGTQFVVNVSCTGPTVSVDEDVTLTYSSQLTGSVAFDAPSDETVTCTVTEKDPLGGAVSASIGPNNGVVVVTVEAPVADVVVTNHYGEPPVEVQGLVVTDTLPFTGSSTDVLLKSGAWLLGIGGVFLLVSWTRTSS